MVDIAGKESKGVSLWKQPKDSLEIAELQKGLNRLIEDGVIEASKITEEGYGRQTRDAVRELQRYLNEQGFRDNDGKKLKIDGLYGQKTRATYAKFWKESLPTPTGVRKVLSRAAFGAEGSIAAAFHIEHVPVEGYQPRYNYGDKRPEYTTKDGTVVPRHKHEGLDIYAPVGTDIHSVSEGKVTVIVKRREGSGGMQVEITAPGGTVVRYMHLDSIASGLKVGDDVKPGDVIGALGRTGFAMGSATAAHLHFELENKHGRAFDPSPQMRGAYSMFEHRKRMVAVIE